MTQIYGPEYTKKMGALKEAKDYYAQQPLSDQIIDLRNNWRGIEYAVKNPKATKEDILKYAYEQAIKNYEQDYNSSNLYEILKSFG